MSTASQLLNSTMPRDLRSGGPADAGAGTIYEVDPAAVARLKQHIAQKQAAAPVTAPPAASQTAVSAEPTPDTTGPDPAALYPAAVIAAAREQEQATGRRNLASVLTDDVLAVWDRWNSDGMSTHTISKKANNGLIELGQSDVRRYLLSYRKRLAVAELDHFPEPTRPAAATPEPKTAVPSTSPGRKAVVVHQAVGSKPALAEPAPTEPTTAAPAPTPAEPVAPPPPVAAAADDPAPLPKPEVEALETAVEPFAIQRPENLPPWLDRQWAPPPPAPRPGDALAALASLVNNEQLRIKGSVKLNLEIEFGE